uniref:Uncharacterized protein n=1 Tax=Glossina brevipalpis TaxID=37001 RepID=A0A1A9WB83_9MUSC
MAKWRPAKDCDALALVGIGGGGTSGTLLSSLFEPFLIFSKSVVVLSVVVAVVVVVGGVEASSVVSSGELVGYGGNGGNGRPPAAPGYWRSGISDGAGAVGRFGGCGYAPGNGDIKCGGKCCCNGPGYGICVYLKRTCCLGGKPIGGGRPGPNRTSGGFPKP